MESVIDQFERANELIGFFPVEGQSCIHHDTVDVDILSVALELVHLSVVHLKSSKLSVICQLFNLGLPFYVFAPECPHSERGLMV